MARWISELGDLGDHVYLVMPTDDGLTLVAVCPSIERRNEVRADREAVARIFNRMKIAAARCNADREPAQPIRSANSTMIPAGPRT